MTNNEKTDTSSSGAIDETWRLINEIANTTDEMLDMFADTPIFYLLKTRRVFCRALKGQILTKHHKAFLNMYQTELMKYLLII